jgi:hypothetical protein
VSRPKTSRGAKARRAGADLLATRSRKIGAALVTTVAALASLTTVLQYVDNRLSPSRPEPTVAAKSAQIRSVTLSDVREPLADYLRKATPTDDRNYTADELAGLGYEFLLQLVATGDPGTRLRLRWQLHEDGRGRVPGASYAQVSSDFETSKPKQDREWAVWVPHPAHDGRYFVRFILEDDRHRLVDQEDSRRFEHGG